MENRKKVFRAFTLLEVLIVISIFIILSAVGFSGFLTIRETFIAKENVELIIQDIQSAKLKAMNMGKDKEPTWIYGFGVDFRNADRTYATMVKGVDTVGDYKMFKWCSPISQFGEQFVLGSTPYDLTGGVLPNFYSSYPVNQLLPTQVNLCNVLSQYRNGRVPADCGLELDGYTDDCTVGSTSLVSISGEGLSLLNRDFDQFQILDLDPAVDGFPGFVFFEALTGRAIIYNHGGLPGNYEDGSLPGEVLFKSDEFIPLDIVLTRKRSNTFDMITVYPLSGEIIHHFYSRSDVADAGDCGSSILDCFTFEGTQYKRYGIEDEIRSFRD